VTDVNTISVLWFRRDLRLGGNHALDTAVAASSDGRVVGLYVDDPAFDRARASARGRYLASSLAALDSELGGGLVRRRGRPDDVLVAVVDELSARTGRRVEVHVTGDVSAAGRRRDAGVASAVARSGSVLVETGTSYCSVDEVRTTSGTRYQVFTPWLRRWRDTVAGRRIGDEAAVGDWDRMGLADTAGIPRAAGTDMVLDSGFVHHAGERAARTRRDAFTTGTPSGLECYHERRNLCGHDASSRLSAALHFGEIHPLQLLGACDGAGDGGATYSSELAWRDFYAEVSGHAPRGPWANIDARYDHLVCDTDAAARARFDAWCAGRTGYPIVDAGMRQLATEGFMHNRVRMITASFLVKDLHLPWQWGARWFLDHLVDGDVASNNMGWQWVAGSGTDAAVYYRVFNPTAQGERFDPDGRYVRTHVAELADEDDRRVHQPAPRGSRHGIAQLYPSPIVDHATERAEALARYQSMRER
jgi:deoxyribodipyrimidine photo-lyase